MTSRERADRAAKAIFTALQTSPDDDRAKATIDVIEKAIIDVVLEERQRCAGVAIAHGTPDADRGGRRRCPAGSASGWESPGRWRSGRS